MWFCNEQVDYPRDSDHSNNFFFIIYIDIDMISYIVSFCEKYQSNYIPSSHDTVVPTQTNDISWFENEYI